MVREPAKMLPRHSGGAMTLLPYRLDIELLYNLLFQNGAINCETLPLLLNQNTLAIYPNLQILSSRSLVYNLELEVKNSTDCLQHRQR